MCATSSVFVLSLENGTDNEQSLHLWNIPLTSRVRALLRNHVFMDYALNLGA